MAALTSEKKIRTRVIAPHVAGCYALREATSGVWGTPWAFLREVQYRDAIGRKIEHGGTRWWLIGCNSHECTALIVVNETDILERLPNG